MLDMLMLEPIMRPIMTRAHISGNVPADIAERLSDQPSFDLEPYMAQAREDLIDAILQGTRFCGLTFEDILDGEIDKNMRMMVADLAQYLCNIVAWARDEYTHSERRDSLEKWMRGMVERYMDAHQELIEERAVEIAADDP